MSNHQDDPGAVITIFLVKGTADSVWKVEKGNWNGIALSATRTNHSDLQEVDEFAGPGVYLMIGLNEKEPENLIHPERIYIGETNDLPSRFKQHLRDEDMSFWNRSIIFTTKDASLNTAHFRYLEARLIKLAKGADRAKRKNANEGSLPVLSDLDIAVAEGFLAEILLICPMLGVQVFQKPGEQASSRYGEPSSPDDQSLGSTRLHLTGPGTKAEGAITADGFVVFAKSFGRIEEVTSFRASYSEFREAMRHENLLIEKSGRLRLTRNHEFSSPSTAASVMLGRNSDGRLDWKTKDGITLKDLQAAESI